MKVFINFSVETRRLARTLDGRHTLFEEGRCCGKEVFGSEKEFLLD